MPKTAPLRPCRGEEKLQDGRALGRRAENVDASASCPAVSNTPPKNTVPDDVFLNLTGFARKPTAAYTALLALMMLPEDGTGTDGTPGGGATTWEPKKTSVRG
jgi:hypothetical protein